VKSIKLLLTVSPLTLTRHSASLKIADNLARVLPEPLLFDYGMQLTSRLLLAKGEHLWEKVIGQLVSTDINRLGENAQMQFADFIMQVSSIKEY
jgi:hypothetical protein